MPGGLGSVMTHFDGLVGSYTVQMTLTYENMLYSNLASASGITKRGFWADPGSPVANDATEIQSLFVAVAQYGITWENIAEYIASFDPLKYSVNVDNQFASSLFYVRAAPAPNLAHTYWITTVDSGGRLIYSASTAGNTIVPALLNSEQFFTYVGQGLGANDCGIITLPASF